MGKVKSAIVLTLITIVIAVLCVVCFVPFPCDGNGLNYFNSILGIAEKDADLGGYLIGETEYVGGGYSAVYYPEGVISGRDYENNLAASSEEEKDDYAADYTPYAGGAIYLEKETVLDGTEVSESFKEDFARAVSVIEERFERLHVAGASVRITDDYTVSVSLPASYEMAGAAFEYLGRMGEFTVSFGSEEASAEVIIPAQRGDLADLGQVAAGFLDAVYVGQLAQLGQRCGQDVAAGAAGDVVQDAGQRNGVRNRGKMRDQPGLAGLVVVRRHQQQRVGAHLLGMPAQLDGIRRVVRAGPGDDRHAAGRVLHRKADALGVLLVRQRGRFAGRAADDDGVDAVFDLVVDDAA